MNPASFGTGGYLRISPVRPC